MVERSGDVGGMCALRDALCCMSRALTRLDKLNFVQISSLSFEVRKSPPATSHVQNKIYTLYKYHTSSIFKFEYSIYRNVTLPYQ